MEEIDDLEIKSEIDGIIERIDAIMENVEKLDPGKDRASSQEGHKTE